MAGPKTPNSQAVPRPRVITICTNQWPERDRVALFREAFGGDRIRVEPSPDEPLQIDATLMQFPGLGLLSGHRSALRSDFADGHDRLIFNLGSGALAKQFGREVVLQSGDAIALSGADLGSLTTLRKGPLATLVFPQGALVPVLKEVGASCGRRIPSTSPALRLLRGYLNALHASGGMSEVALESLAIAHIYDRPRWRSAPAVRPRKWPGAGACEWRGCRPSRPTSSAISTARSRSVISPPGTW